MALNSNPYVPAPGSLLMDGVTRAKDLKQGLHKVMDNINSKDLDVVANQALNEMVDDIVLGLCFDLHRSVKTGLYALIEAPEKDRNPSGSASNLDVFGQVITTAVGVPMLKKQPECVCPNCQRNLAASRFAPHLEKCMGMGRNSSRLASRRLASSKESYREGGTNEDEDDAEDEDWIEPGRGGSSGTSGDRGYGTGSKRRQRDKNSPRRNRGKHWNKNSGDNTSREGSVTPPTNFDQLNIEERSHLLSSICGVTSSTSRKICTRSTRCPSHTDAQRREVRIRWLAPQHEGGTSDEHVDIDSFTEGDTVALRERLASLSNASSPAESTISSSSNPSGGLTVSLSGANSTRSSGTRRDKRGRGKKNGKSSKGGSRGTTPPLMTTD